MKVYKSNWRNFKCWVKITLLRVLVNVLLLVSRLMEILTIKIKMSINKMM